DSALWREAEVSAGRLPCPYTSWTSRVAIHICPSHKEGQRHMTYPPPKATKEMHELPVTESILKIVLQHAPADSVSKIVRIFLDVGELSDLEDEWIQHYFDYL